MLTDSYRQNCRIGHQYPFLFAIRSISCAIVKILQIFDCMYQKIYFTYSYRRRALLETMLEVNKKIKPSFFCNKSMIEHGIEFNGLINKQERMEDATTVQENDRVWTFMIKNQFVVTSVTDSLGKLMMMQKLLCQCVADVPIPYQKAMTRYCT